MARYRSFITKVRTFDPRNALPYDPINLVFYGDAPFQRVASYLKDPKLNIWSPPVRQARSWNDTGTLLQPATPMWAHLDNRAAGAQGWHGWKLPDAQLAIGQYTSGMRMHIRIYGSNDPQRPNDPPPADPDLGIWCIAAVHREHWLPPFRHVIHGWDEARDFVEEWFARAAADPTSGVHTITNVAIGNEGWYQGSRYDGMAAFIQLT